MSRFDDPARAPFYFAYGSNMDERQMRARVPGTELLGVGHLLDHEFLFSGYSDTWRGSVANVRRKKGSKVFGVLYALPPFGLAKLDRFEGYPRSYQRKTGNIVLRGGGDARAVLYYKRDPQPLAPPSKAYVNQILKAIRKHRG